VFGLGSAGVAAVKLLVALGKEVVASDATAPATPHAALPGVRYSYGANELGEATAVVLSLYIPAKGRPTGAYPFPAKERNSETERP